MKFGIPASSQAEAKLFDESGPEVDEDVFEEVLKQPNLGIFLLRLENLSNGNFTFTLKALSAVLLCVYSLKTVKVELKRVFL